MKADYTISGAKQKLIMCGNHFEGKKICGIQPGIGGWGAADFLRKRGYMLAFEIPKSVKLKIISGIRG